MTIKELIAKLQNFPQHYDVCIGSGILNAGHEEVYVNEFILRTGRVVLVEDEDDVADACDGPYSPEEN